MKIFLEQVRDERQLKALIGLNRDSFDKLLEEFSKSLSEIATENYKTNKENRKRRPGGGQKGKLVTAENKLCLVLFYLKNYPTFDLLGCVFELSRSKAEENLKKLLPVVKKAQSKLDVLPSQEIKSVKELEELVEKATKEECQEPAISQEPEKLQLVAQELEKTKEPQFINLNPSSSDSVKQEEEVLEKKVTKEAKSLQSCGEILIEEEVKGPQVINPSSSPKTSPKNSRRPVKRLSKSELDKLGLIGSGLTNSQEAKEQPNCAKELIKPEGNQKIEDATCCPRFMSVSRSCQLQYYRCFMSIDKRNKH